MIKLDINIGDIILVGRFKNKRIEVKEIGEDENGLPTINGKNILKIRIEKFMKTKKNPVKESFRKNLKEYLNPSKTDNYQLYRLPSNSPSPGHGEYLYASANNLDTLFDNWISTMKRGGYGYDGADLARIRKEFSADKLNYWSSGKGGLFYKLKVKKQIKESKQFKLAEAVIDYEDEIVAPSWLVKGHEYVWIMGAAPLLVIYTGPGKKPGSKNFKFKEKPAVNHDLSVKDVRKYIKYKEGAAPGPFGHDDSPLGGLNKFKNPIESKQFSLAGIAKKILKESTDYYPKKGDKVEATFIGTNPKYKQFKNTPFIDIVTAVISPSTEPWLAINFKNHGQIKDYNDWNFVKVS